MSATLRQLKIKTSSVKRLVKDKQCYIIEADQQRARIEDFKARNAHEADIRKQNEVLDESLAMLPDTEKRIRAAMEDLENLIAAGAQGVEGSQELADAKDAVEKAKAALSQ